MTDRPSTPDVLRDWARAPIPVEESSVNEERRARVVSQLARSIRETKLERERAQRRTRVLAVLAIAAAIALVAGGLWRTRTPGTTPVASVRPSSTGVLVTHGAESRVPAVNADQALAGGDVVSTVADARATLRLASGAEVSVEPSTRLSLARLAPGDEQLDVRIGEISVRVPRLGDKGRFQVSTPDALVTVHGTVFVVRVTKRDDGSIFTDVSVSEGKVSVTRNGSESFLSPGQSFSSKPPAEEKATRAEPAPAPAAEPAKEDKPHASAAPSPAAPKLAATDPSALAEQNRLFSAAATARRNGDDKTALGHLNQLLARYPSSPLAPEARVERFRALERLGQHEEAAREARRYLADQESGPARDEARNIALDPKAKPKPKK